MGRKRGSGSGALLTWLTGENGLDGSILRLRYCSFCTTDAPYTSSLAWPSEFGSVWVAIRENVIYYGKSYPSRLVIFEGETKVDFSFLDQIVIEQMIKSQTLSDEFQTGYRLLFDMENKFNGLPPPQFPVKAKKTSEEEFQNVIQEFWFEAYHVGIYLK